MYAPLLKKGADVSIRSDFIGNDWNYEGRCDGMVSNLG